MEDQKPNNCCKKKQLRFWLWTIVAVVLRLVLSYLSKHLSLSYRPEVSTPLTSLRRLSEGYWLKQLSMSPYSGSMYHGSPLLLSILGPLTSIKIKGQPDHILCSLVSVIADFTSAILIRSTGQSLIAKHGHKLKTLGIVDQFKDMEVLPSGDIAAIVYLWNPCTVVSCVGFNTSPIENLIIVLSLYGASSGKIPLAAFGWAVASHLSLYPLILVIPVILLLGYGSDAPPRKLFMQNIPQDDKGSAAGHTKAGSLKDKSVEPTFSWQRVIHFILWASLWVSYILILCAVSMKDYGGLGEMFKRTYGFILTVEDLSPNIGVLWYFFAEVFEVFRNFFLIVFHLNIAFMVLPLAIRLNHRPCFLAFIYLTISAVLKSYPSIGDSALYLSLLMLFVNELSEMQFSFFLVCGYVGVSLLSPIMHNLWIWRGTGNANFYFATAIAYACFQIVLVVESVSAMLNYDRKISKLCNAAKD